MKTRRFVRLSLVFLAVVCITVPAWAAQKVVVVSGVTEKNAVANGNQLVCEGIKETLKPADIVPDFLWVELDSLASDDLRAAAADTIIAEARAKKPDVIIALNDNLLGYMVKKVDDIPVVFCWIFKPPQLLGLPKANFTGVTRMSYAADIWIMTRQLTGAKTVGLLSKNNPSMAGVKKYLAAGADKLEAASGVRYKDMYLVNSFDDWKKAVNTFPYDFIYLADTSRIRDGDRELSRKETVGWTVEHSKVPVIAATEVDVEAGGLFSIVTSERTIGAKAGESALKILNGTPPSNVPYVTSSKGNLLVNLKTAQKYNIEIPYDLLATATKVYE